MLGSIVARSLHNSLIAQSGSTKDLTLSFSRQLCYLTLSLLLLFSSGCADTAGPSGANGRILWRVPTASVGFPLDPVANADRSMVYFGTSGNRIKKIRGADGNVMWDRVAGSPIALSPQWNAVLSADVVAISKGDVFAFDTTTGTQRWVFRGTGSEIAGYNPLVANDSMIFIGGRSGKAYGVSARSGMALWTTDLRNGNAGDIGILNPGLSGRLLYVCTTNFTANPAAGTFWALDSNTGVVRWSHAFEPELPGRGATCFGSPAFWHDLVIQPQSDGRVFAFNKETGAVRWIAPPFITSPHPQRPLAGLQWGGIRSLSQTRLYRE